MKKYCLLWMLGIWTLCACKKSADKPGRPAEPVVTEKGVPRGAATRATIGPAGGSFTSADGWLTITVPPGAVTANTEFGIQPITNTLTEDSAVLNYRLTPEGATFRQPVNVVFRYDQPGLNGALEEGMIVSYQTGKGNWKAVPATLDTQANQIRIATSHFSDWSITSILNLKPDKTEVVAGEETRFRITGMVPSEEDDLLAPLLIDDLSGWIHTIRDWDIIAGDGVLSDVTNEPLVKIYTAPAHVAATQQVELQVELNGNMWVPDAGAPDGRRKMRQVIMLSSVTLLGGSYMVGSFNGQPINTAEVTALYSNGKIYVTGHTPGGSVYLEMNGSGAETYPCGDRMLPGTSFVGAVKDGAGAYSYGSEYVECGPPQVRRYSGGTVDIKAWGAVGQPVEGTFTGKLYSGPCNDREEKQLSVKFRTVRIL